VSPFTRNHTFNVSTALVHLVSMECPWRFGYPGYPIGYTAAVKMLKVRRVGNSNMVALPKEWEDDGFGPGAYVLAERDEAGEVRILRAGDVPARIDALADEMIEKHAEALHILAEHDASPG
jgi:hypothetical protein